MTTLFSNQDPAATNSDATHNRRKLSKMLQLHGYSACREALVLLEDHFTSSTSYETMEEFINKLNQIITFQTDAGTSVIDPDLAYLVVQKLTAKPQATQNDTDQSRHVIEEVEPELPSTLAVKVKNVQYEHAFDSAISKTNNRLVGERQATEFNIHYNFLLKKLSCLPIFQGDFQLMKLATLTGSSQPSIRCICFGLLIKDISKIDGYMLIDSTGRVPVRITPDTTFRNRLFYTDCIVLLEGVYINPDDVLFAANVGLPPILLEPIPDKSLACLNEQMVVILKELYLDDDDVCKSLDMLFTGYNSMEDPPMLFILIGDFTRAPCRPTIFRTHMKKLIRILRTCDNLKNCHFVFIPGQRDTSPIEDSALETIPKTSNTMPKAPLTKEQFSVNLLQLSNINNVHLASNPAHIYLGERRISVVAHSYLKRLKNNLIHDLSDHRQELFDTTKQIMLSNAHLSAGIAKTYHSSMNLWHRPDLLVLADTEAFGNRYDYSSSSSRDTSFTTVPSFSRQSNQFKVYYVKTGEVEDSQVSSDAIEEIEADGPEVVDLIETQQTELD